MSDESMQSNVSDELANDIVWGVDGIGKVINRNARQTFHLIDTRKPPIKNRGAMVCVALGIAEILRRRPLRRGCLTMRNLSLPWRGPSFLGSEDEFKPYNQMLGTYP